MRLPLQTGHLPGFLNLSLFLKTKPQSLHCGGVTDKTLPDLFTVFLICSRCRQTSFSDILTCPDMSLAERGFPSIREIMPLRIVSCLSRGTGSFLFFIFSGLYFLNIPRVKPLLRKNF